MDQCENHPGLPWWVLDVLYDSKLAWHHWPGRLRKLRSVLAGFATFRSNQDHQQANHPMSSFSLLITNSPWEHVNREANSFCHRGHFWSFLKVSFRFFRVSLQFEVSVRFHLGLLLFFWVQVGFVWTYFKFFLGFILDFLLISLAILCSFCRDFVSLSFPFFSIPLCVVPAIFFVVCSDLISVCVCEGEVWNLWVLWATQTQPQCPTKSKTCTMHITKRHSCTAPVQRNTPRKWEVRIACASCETRFFYTYKPLTLDAWSTSNPCRSQNSSLHFSSFLAIQLQIRPSPRKREAWQEKPSTLL